MGKQLTATNLDAGSGGGQGCCGIVMRGSTVNSHIHKEGVRGKERKGCKGRERGSTCTHTHTQRERGRENVVFCTHGEGRDDILD
jgi:hypothetical protein